MHGNGGFAGETPETGARPRYRAAALRNGFVTASTNTGHDAATEPVASFAVNAQKRIDYAFRAVHLTATEGKRIAAAYYWHPPAYAYWDGCSTGGRQGLISAQRFPADFDGIVAGAPAYDPIYLPAWRMRLFMTVLRSPLYALPPEKLKLLNDAVLDKCDALDGVKDHFISDPRKCNFDPNVLKCKTASTASCLTPEQLETLNAAYSD